MKTTTTMSGWLAQTCYVMGEKKQTLLTALPAHPLALFFKSLFQAALLSQHYHSNVNTEWP